jgi:protein-tyrosine kinase
MSRIHEALQRAQGEGHVTLSSSDPVQAVEAVLPAPESRGFESVWNSCAERSWSLDPNFNVFANTDAGPLLGEQFRVLRSRLYQIRESQSIRSILIASGNPSEGKTFVAANLAQALARKNDARVLLIDADLRRSKLHEVFGAPSVPGLSEYLAGHADLVRVLQRGLTEHLCFIPAGSHATHPADLIANGRFKELLDRFAEAFDWIVVDSPPATSIADANILAGLCDGVLFVVRAGLTPAATLQNFRQQLPGRKIIGVVLNAAEQTQSYGSYYAGYMRRREKQASPGSILPLKQSASKILFSANPSIDPIESKTNSEQRS